MFDFLRQPLAAARARYSKTTPPTYRRSFRSSPHSYETLEPRQMLAFSGVFDGVTLTLDQTADEGAVVIDNNGAGNAFRVNDGGGLVTYVAATNVVVNMLDGTTNQLDFDLDNAHVGSVELDLGNGARNVNFTGTSNSMGGDLTVNAGDDTQVLEVGVNAGLTVGGNLLFDLGSGLDAVDEDNSNISVTGNFDFVGVNFFENGGTMTVGGNVTVDTTGEIEDTLFDDDATMTVTGDFLYMGGDGRDEVTMNGVALGTSFGGNATINVGDNTTGGVQFIFFNLPNSSVGGTLTAISTSATNLDSFALHPAGNFGGDIFVDLGEGPNDAVFAGVFGGTSIDYRGGSDVDNVTFGTTGNPADVDIRLGAGDDNFALNAGAMIDHLRVDFGGGLDSFVNAFGTFNFDAAFVNFNGFNDYYSDSLGQWNLVQTMDIGDMVVTVDAVGEVSISSTLASTSDLSPADNLRVTLLDDTGDLEFNQNSALAGFAFFKLGNGDRTFSYTGSNNFISGFLRIEASSGDQTVELSQTNSLFVGGTAIINLREGHDVVTNANSISAGNFILRSVNNWELNANVITLGNMVFNTTFEVADSRIDNDGTLIVGNRFYYLGGEGQDDIILNDGVVVGDLYADLGNGIGFPSQSVDLTGGFHSLGRTSIKGGTAYGGNLVKMDATTQIDGNVVIDFTGSTSDNQAIFDGLFTGNYGVYRGGSGQDTVSMDAVAGDMDFILRLGAGSDTFSLLSGTDVAFLFADFGADVDIFNDDFAGVYPFPVNVINLP